MTVQHGIGGAVWISSSVLWLVRLLSSPLIGGNWWIGQIWQWLRVAGSE